MGGQASLAGRSECSRVYRRLSQVRNRIPRPPLICLCVRSGCGRIGLTATAARKALQESVQEDEIEEDEDEQRYLNLNEEEGDVWDDDSAYIEMLAKEVRARLLLPSSVGMW